MDLEDPNFDHDSPRHERLSAAMRGWLNRPADVPERVDRAVAEATSAHFAHRRRQSLALRRFARWGVAAVLVAGIGLSLMRPRLFGPAPTTPQRSVQVAGDVDGNQRVDILDAFALARMLKAQGSAAGSDVSGDGRIDEADVRAIAMRAVSVGGKG